MKSFIVLLALSTPLFARLGETMEQCVERYGKPTKIDEKGTKFSKSGITISVDFYQNKVVSIFYSKKDEKLTKSEIETLIKTNLPDIKMDIIESGATTIYEDKDGRYSASEGIKMSFLLIFDVEGYSQFEKQEEARQKAEADKSLKGF